jgi:OmpA-OmpF porin, OOP family
MVKTICRFFIAIVPFLISVGLTAQTESLITINPIVQRATTNLVHIKKVELTPKATIFYMEFDNSSKKKTLAQKMEELMNGGQVKLYYETISFQKYSYLQANNQQFGFIKASGIPINPEVLKIEDTRKINFKLYFEPLPPGIEKFDFIENSTDNVEKGEYFRYWNFFNVEINNPAIAPNITKAAVPKEKETQVKVQGKVLESIAQKPIIATIYLKNNEGETAIDSTVSFPKSGNFTMENIQANKQSLFVFAEGFFPKIVALNDQNVNEELVISLEKVEANSLVKLESIYFDTGSFELLPTSNASLNLLTEWMLNNPQIKIKLEGHTDSQGDPDANEELSLQRVLAVKKHLTTNNVNEKNIKVEGFGGRKPLNTNTTDTDRRLNRRVEIRILEN